MMGIYEVAEVGGEGLFYAVRVGNANAARDCIERGIKPDVQNKEGQTPLHKVAYSFDRDIAKLLVMRGANVNATDNRGQTPLHMAAYFNNCEAAQFLVGQGAYLNMKDTHGRTPFDCAVWSGNFEIAKTLMKLGAEGKMPAETQTRRTISPLTTETEVVHITPVAYQEKKTVTQSIADFFSKLLTK